MRLLVVPSHYLSARERASDGYGYGHGNPDLGRDGIETQACEGGVRLHGSTWAAVPPASAVYQRAARRVVGQSEGLAEKWVELLARVSCDSWSLADFAFGFCREPSTGAGPT